MSQKLVFLILQALHLGKVKSLRIIQTHLSVGKDGTCAHDWDSWAPKSPAPTRLHLCIAFLHPLKLLQTWVYVPDWISILDVSEGSDENKDPLGLLRVFSDIFQLFKQEWKTMSINVIYLPPGVHPDRVQTVRELFVFH